MTERFRRQDLMQKQAEVFKPENKDFGGPIYKTLPKPMTAGKYDNKILVLEFMPVVIAPEIFSQFYAANEWTWVAPIFGHFINNPADPKRKQFVYCPHRTAKAYNESGRYNGQIPECRYCRQNVEAQQSYLMQTFDLNKFLGERPLDKNETAPTIQLYYAPYSVFEALYKKDQLKQKFLDSVPVFITKTTQANNNFSKYAIDTANYEIPQLTSNPQWTAYLYGSPGQPNPNWVVATRYDEKIKDWPIKVDGASQPSSQGVEQPQQGGFAQPPMQQPMQQPVSAPNQMYNPVQNTQTAAQPPVQTSQTFVPQQQPVMQQPPMTQPPMAAQPVGGAYPPPGAYNPAMVAPVEQNPNPNPPGVTVQGGKAEVGWGD